ncbi:hypothetical protein QYF36_021662 [Acer negundo]|nr:hypothetical protein QYF36_021662 [Acer negundo]
MSGTFSGGSDTEISDNLKTRTLSEISEVGTIRISVDLVSAARRNIGFLRVVNESQWLHEESNILEAIRRYDELWMPLICDLTAVGSMPPMVLPPFDVEWVWFCHTLNPVSYRQYCESRFSKLIGKPAIFDEENEGYAFMRCKEIWVQKYPSESFENEVDSDSKDPIFVNEDILSEVKKQRFLYSRFSEPYMSEIVYLIAARQRYKGFSFMLQKFSDGCSHFVPASDILLMWIAHLSYPTVYAEDLNDMWDDMGKAERLWGTMKAKEMEETKKLWEKTFDQPYEKAGGGLGMEFDRVASVKPPVNLMVSDKDVNTKYKSMVPRFLLEVCMFLKLKSRIKATQEDTKCDFLRLGMVRCHRELKLDKPISNLSCDSWQKASHLYCEFGTRGLMLELRHCGGTCFKGSKSQGTAAFHWNDLLRAPSLSMERGIEQVRVAVSITPPVQAPYLLKCVPDRVTDDSGAMISDVILRLNRYRPQEGRWLSRTVLDYAGRECFVVRLRVGGGFWRRGGETPSTVKWEDRIIEIREGSWSYVAGSIGRAPEKVVGTATPKEPATQYQAEWLLSTGDELMISWESLTSTSTSGMSFTLRNQTSPDSSLRLLKGRKLQYQKSEEHVEDEDEEGFVTLIRFTEDNPNGKVTALLNWKLLVMELMPEEDAVFVLLLCISILRSVSEMKREDVGSLLIRRRLKEAKPGARDWGSVILHPSSMSSSINSPYIQPWYWNAKAVIADTKTDYISRPPPSTYSAVEGGDKLYKRVIIT